jgi:hypothetical protein
LTALDAVSTDYDTHRAQLLNKLVAIVDERVLQYCVELRTTTTAITTTTTTTTTTPPPPPPATTATNSASDAMHRLTNDVAAFHRALSRTVDDTSLTNILVS